MSNSASRTNRPSSRLAGAAASTPRPWRVYEHDPLVIVAGDGFSVCDTSPGNPIDVSYDEAEANAELIVRAVNAHDDMLAALKDTVLQLQYLADKFGETGSGAQVLARVNAAIAKAEAVGDRTDEAKTAADA